MASHLDVHILYVLSGLFQGEGSEERSWISWVSVVSVVTPQLAHPLRLSPSHSGSPPLSLTLQPNRAN